MAHTPGGHKPGGHVPEGHEPGEVSVAVTAALTGTALPSLKEGQVVAGGRTIIITLSGDQWVAAGATFDAQRQNIIDGLDSDGAEATGWNTIVRDSALQVTDVVRTSDTVVTITLPAAASYDVTANETVTATVPATALTGATELVAAPTVTITVDITARPDLKVVMDTETITIAAESETLTVAADEKSRPV